MQSQNLKARARVPPASSLAGKAFTAHLLATQAGRHGGSASQEILAVFLLTGFGLRSRFCGTVFFGPPRNRVFGTMSKFSRTVYKTQAQCH